MSSHIGAKLSAIPFELYGWTKVKNNQNIFYVRLDFTTKREMALNGCSVFTAVCHSDETMDKPPWKFLV